MYRRHIIPVRLLLTVWGYFGYVAVCVHLFGRVGALIGIATPIAYVALLFWAEEKQAK